MIKKLDNAFYQVFIKRFHLGVTALKDAKGYQKEAADAMRAAHLKQAGVSGVWKKSGGTSKTPEKPKTPGNVPNTNGMFERAVRKTK